MILYRDSVLLKAIANDVQMQSLQSKLFNTKQKWELCDPSLALHLIANGDSHLVRIRDSANADNVPVLASPLQSVLNWFRSLVR